MASSCSPPGLTILQGGFGALDVAALQISTRQARHRFGMAGLVLQHMAIGLRRHGDVAGFQRLCRHREHLGGVFGAAMAMVVAVRPPPASAATKAFTWLSGMAPMKPSTGWPFLKA